LPSFLFEYLSAQLSLRVHVVPAAIRDFSQALSNGNADSVDNRKEEEASGKDEHCYQVLFNRLGPPEKNNWTTHEKQIDHREHAPKAVPRLPHSIYKLQESELQMACHLTGAPNNVVHTARIAIEARLHALYWAVPECGHNRLAVREPQVLEREGLSHDSGSAV